MKKIWGNIIFGLAKIVDVFLSGLIKLFDWITRFAEQIKGFIVGFVVLGCFMFFAYPFMFLVLLTPAAITVITIVLLIFLIPLLGKKVISALKYARYVSTEYLYDYADYYRLGKSKKVNFRDYSNRYKKEEEEKRRRAQEERQRQQNEEWQKIFDDFFNQAGGGNYGGGYYGQGSYGQGSYNQGYGGYNPTDDFNSKYEKSCDALGLDYSTDIYEVKLQYRKLAKKYHPDLNKAEDAKEKFQEINEAYEFLSEENIERYKRLNKL